jgi:hypothetical protein
VALANADPSKVFTPPNPEMAMYVNVLLGVPIVAKDAVPD